MKQQQVKPPNFVKADTEVAWSSQRLCTGRARKGQDRSAKACEESAKILNVYYEGLL